MSSPRQKPRRPARPSRAACILLAASLAACTRQPDPSAPGSRTVVVYTALDREFSEPIFRLFTERTGIAVAAQYDTESTKTVGLANRIRAERGRPRCDVFWNNEVLNTIRLEEEGLLQAVAPTNADLYPAAYRDPGGSWFGFAARARVLIVNTALVPDGPFPSSIRDLGAPAWKGKTAIAKPLFGTTASHVACLFAKLGAGSATALLDSLKANGVQVHGGNKGCAMAVAAGEAAFGLTDTDDAWIEIAAGKPVRVVYPDSAAGAPGTLFLPNTVAVVRGAPSPREAAELVDFLLSPEVELRLAACPSAQVPLHRGAPPGGRVKGPGEVEAMDVDFIEAARAFETARWVVEDRFLR